MQYSPATFSKAVVSIANDARTADIDGTGVDARGFEQMLVLMDLGDLTDAGTLVISLEESDDDGASDAYTAITGATYTVDTAADDNEVHLGALRLHKKARYIRASADADGVQSHTYGVTLVLLAPQSDDYATSTMEFAVA